MTEIARSVEIDMAQGRLLVDGEELGYFLTDTPPTVQPLAPGLFAVTVGLLVDGTVTFTPPVAPPIDDTPSNEETADADEHQ